MVNFQLLLKSLKESSKKKTKETVKSQNVAKEQRFADYLRNITVGGWSSKFVSDIYKEQTLFPHEEMEIAKKAYRYNSYLQAAVNTRANFALGGSINIVSSSKLDADWLNKMIKITGLMYYSQYLFKDAYTVGNFYAERVRDGKGRIVAYEWIPHAERIYVDLDSKGNVSRYVQELPERYLHGVNFTTIDYYGEQKKTIKGIEIPANKMFHIKYGCAEIPAYGRGLVAAAVNDAEIMLEIERAIAVISRYKAIPKKLVQILETDEQKAADYLANQLSNLADDENPIVVGEHKVDDLSYSGQESNWQPIVNYVKKKVTVSIAPAFLMHGEETNYAVSRDQRAGFQLAIGTDRDIIKEQLKSELKLMASSHGKNIKDFDIEFGDFDLGEDQEKRQYAQNAFQSGMLTLNEVREILGYPPDEENGDLYSYELQAQAQLFGGSGMFTDAESEIENPSSQQSNP